MKVEEVTKAAAATAVGADDEKTEKLSKRLKRCGYIRRMMQQYRQKEKTDLAYLGKDVLALEFALNDLQTNPRKGRPSSYDPRAPLPWKYIADALRVEHHYVAMQKELLQERLDSVSTLVRDMSQRVATHCTPLPVRPSLLSFHFDIVLHVTLLSGLESRQLGKDWILQQMYHNTDRIFQQYAFPPMDTCHSFRDVDVRFNDDGSFVYVARHQLT
ncbi:Aste57867_8657 [Aphanomyces stellatus]|uniref:Aste57867_8657 protein n=1 Tax=Aphanomyces stellatus TaxID=120398 RepID=A0A485KKU4_9STRA|nr:hypothetical protein As57867_008623 [Aphanomyces stellatus]VFT85543.1 Aste57867_8657 [Aphanomyces stellatus]